MNRGTGACVLQGHQSKHNDLYPHPFFLSSFLYEILINFVRSILDALFWFSSHKDFIIVFFFLTISFYSFIFSFSFWSAYNNQYSVVFKFSLKFWSLVLLSDPLHHRFHRQVAGSGHIYFFTYHSNLPSLLSAEPLSIMNILRLILLISW